MIYCRVGKCPVDNKIPLCCFCCAKIKSCSNACKQRNPSCNLASEESRRKTADTCVEIDGSEIYDSSTGETVGELENLTEDQLKEILGYYEFTEVSPSKILTLRRQIDDNS